MIAEYAECSIDGISGKRRGENRAPTPAVSGSFFEVLVLLSKLLTNHRQIRMRLTKRQASTLTLMLGKNPYARWGWFELLNNQKDRLLSEEG